MCVPTICVTPPPGIVTILSIRCLAVTAMPVPLVMCVQEVFANLVRLLSIVTIANHVLMISATPPQGVFMSTMTPTLAAITLCAQRVIIV